MSILSMYSATILNSYEPRPVDDTIYAVIIIGNVKSRSKLTTTGSCSIERYRPRWRFYKSIRTIASTKRIMTSHHRSEALKL